MAKTRGKKQAAMPIEELSRPQEELTPDQAEAVQGGFTLIESQPLSFGGVLMTDKQEADLLPAVQTSIQKVM